MLKLILPIGALALAALPQLLSAQAPASTAIGDLGAAPRGHVQVDHPDALPGATNRRCETLDMVNGRTYGQFWRASPDYHAEMWFSRNFKGSACLTTIGANAFEIEWSTTVYGFLHEVGRYQFSVPADDISGDPKATYRHEFSNVTGGGGYAGLYGWFGVAGTPESIEYYVVEDWTNGEHLQPGETTKMGSLEIDGGTYGIFHRPRKGNRAAQWWSVRTEKRTSGTISYGRHIAKWRQAGMPNVALTRVAFALEPKWGVPTGGRIRYHQFSIDRPVPVVRD